MLEIPESNTIAKQVNQAIKGKRITKVCAGQSPHGFAFYTGDPAEYPGLLAGRAVTSACAAAGQVEIKIEENILLFGDGANVRYLEPGAKLPKKHQLHLLLEDGSSLICTIQMYGGIWAFAEGTNDNPYYLVTKEKPSPLSDEFSEEYFDRLVSITKSSLSVKALLAAEQRIPGLGNGCLQDILFFAGLNPKTKLSDLNDQRIEMLYHAVKDTLKKMTQQGGRDTEKDLYGNPGGYRTAMSKKTAKQPCPSCGWEIVRQAYMGGNVYFCPVCQPVRPKE